MARAARSVPAIESPRRRARPASRRIPSPSGCLPCANYLSAVMTVPHAQEAASRDRDWRDRLKAIEVTYRLASEQSR
jgi:hypothetical protein